MNERLAKEGTRCDAAAEREAAHVAEDVVRLPVLCTPVEVASWLGITRKSLYHMISRGQIPSSTIVRIGGHMRFDKRRLNDWITHKQHVALRSSGSGLHDS